MTVEHIAAVLNHSSAKGTDKLILIGIANHEGDGGAWPSIETLMKYGNCSRTKVKDSIAALVALGEVRVGIQQGGNMNTRADRRPNRYEVLVVCPADCDGTTAHRMDGGRRGDSRDGGQKSGDGGHFSVPRGSLFDPTGVAGVTTNHPLEPPTTEPPIESPFDAFWSAYPRKQGKSDAMRSYAKAVKRALPSVILAGAQRYAADPNREPQVTAHASTWLNGDRWDDEPLPAPSGKPSAARMFIESADRLATSDAALAAESLRELTQ